MMRVALHRATCASAIADGDARREAART